MYTRAMKVNVRKPLTAQHACNLRRWMILIWLATLCGCERSTGHSSGVVLNNQAFAGQRYSVADVDLQSADLRLVWKKPDGQRFDNFRSVDEFLRQSGDRLLFATNSGIFDPSFTPCGLHVESGKEITPLNLKNGEGNFYLKPNGVFLIDQAGARIVPSEKYSTDITGVRLAAQSGPMLLIDGTINAAFALDSQNRKIRSGVGIVSPQRVAFVLSRDAVTFHEFAAFFQTSLGCSNALYLDGQISRFYDPDHSPPPSDEHFAGMFAIAGRQ
jgi:uncharacterized protein YigE (DUF2233 family)